jgi:hypothetical protein
MLHNQPDLFLASLQQHTKAIAKWLRVVLHQLAAAHLVELRVALHAEPAIAILATIAASAIASIAITSHKMAGSSVQNTCT